MANRLFNSIQQMRPKNNVFDLSHDVKLSCKMGELIPTLMLECVPGDKFNLGCDSLLRFAPLIAPVMHRIDVSMHYFFVPNRLLWPGWEKFITDPTSTDAFPYKIMNQTNYTPLSNYLGIPVPPAPGPGIGPEIVSALPWAAYQLIWKEYYRDQNLQPVNDDDFILVNGNNSTNAEFNNLRRRAWEHDYFTSALPFAQKGTAVSMPFNPIPDLPVFNNRSSIGDPGTTLDGTPNDQIIANNPSLNATIPVDQLYASTDGVNTGATTINDFRRALKLQEWLEKAARGGSRYIENIFSHFGVKSSDARLNRPEYIVGTKSPVIISEVLNTTGTADAPQGNMAGHAVSVTQGKYGAYRCEEHGFIVGMMSVLPKTAYMQGIPKHFLKINDPFQYFWPSFANLGEQPITNNELYAYQDGVQLDTFGYTPRYADYKFQPNRVAGDFRGNLDIWHLARKFDTPPELNSTFIECDPSQRIFAVNDDTDNLWCQILHKIRAVRPMPKFGTPTL